ncbi:MAG: DUF4333 domain-containing protein [Gordonia sp. (in: high G+C Gram-positive bacteria)]|uniref:DUF4333 domain-containing protein n=1 Tax=Gordonia sp. (in: high G+C Gram-positive bacteria) TaxID=84139 RepID=UPI0039E2F363
MRTRIAGGIAAAALTLTALTGCSFGKSIDKAELETQTQKALQPQFSLPITVQCKGDLKAEEGATQECALEGASEWQLVTVTATGDDGTFNAKAVPGVVDKPSWAK